MAVKSKTQLAADIAVSTFSAPQQVILDDMVDSYQNLAQNLTTVQIAAIATPTSGQLVYNTDLSQFQYYNGVSWQTLGATQTRQITITAAQLSAIATTPVDLIPAQGAGLAVDILSIVRKSTFVTTAYDFANPINICSESNAAADYYASIGFFVLNSTATSMDKINLFGESDDTQLIKANEKIQLKGIANPTVGDGTLTLWITYVVIAV